MRTSTDSLTSRGAVRWVWRSRTPVELLAVVHTLCLQARTDHRAVDGNFGARGLHPLLGGSLSVGSPQQILNVKRRASRRRSELRSRRFIVKHVDFF